MGQAPLAAIAASARKDTEPFLDALQRLEDRAEERFEHAIVKPLGAELKRFALHLHKLLNEENLDLDTLKQEAERLHKTFDQTSQRLTRSHETLESELATRLPRVVDVVRHGLTGEQDTLARRALQGRDISSDIGLTIRRLISQGVEQEIKPVFQRHLSQSAHLMAENWGEELELQVSDLSRIAADVAIDDSIDMEKLLIQILTILLPKMPTLLKLVSVIGPFLQKWFNDKQAEVAREKQLEELRQEIIQRIIPEVLSQLQTHLNAALQRTTGELQGLLEQELEEQYQRHQQTIAQLQRQVQASEEEQQRRNAAQRSALEFVRTLDDLLAMDAPQ
jgi:hypothetical protein